MCLLLVRDCAGGVIRRLAARVLPHIGLVAWGPHVEAEVAVSHHLRRVMGRESLVGNEGRQLNIWCGALVANFGHNKHFSLNDGMLKWLWRRLPPTGPKRVCGRVQTVIGGRPARGTVRQGYDRV